MQRLEAPLEVIRGVEGWDQDRDGRKIRARFEFDDLELGLLVRALTDAYRLRRDSQSLLGAGLMRRTGDHNIEAMVGELERLAVDGSDDLRERTLKPEPAVPFGDARLTPSRESQLHD